MCLNPILIKNPNADLSGRRYYLNDAIDALGKNPKYKGIHDNGVYMYVPCGTCEECCHKKQMYLIQRCQEQSKDSHIIFCTNTYKDSMLPGIEVNNGYHRCVLWSDFVNMMKRCRRKNILPEYKYLCVNEYGGNTHRPHLHYLLFVKKLSPDESPFKVYEYAEKFEKFMLSGPGWSRNFSRNWRKPLYSPISDFRKFANGHSTYDVDPVLGDSENVSFYVSKYLCKFDPWIKKKQQAFRLNLSPEDYYFYWNIIKPRILVSKHFGLTDETPDYIRECISFSLANDYGPCYYNSVGFSSPLSPYYRRLYLDLDSAYAFARKNPDRLDSDSNTSYHHFRNLDEIASSKTQFASKHKLILENNS